MPNWIELLDPPDTTGLAHREEQAKASVYGGHGIDVYKREPMQVEQRIQSRIPNHPPLIRQVTQDRWYENAAVLYPGQAKLK